MREDRFLENADPRGDIVSVSIKSIVVAVIAITAWILGIFPELSLFVFGVALVLSLILMVVALGEKEKLPTTLDPRTTLDSKEQEILNVIVGDIPVLARKKFQQTAANEYGIVEEGPWRKEWDNYSHNILPVKCRDADIILPDNIHKYLIGDTPERKQNLICRAVHERIESAVAEMRDTAKDLQDVSPLEFEVLCLEKLKALGWDARTTKASGDQGADVIATHCDEILVVQCKLYGRPVGNKAVQEVAAARDHYRADYAAVVTNASFTRAANDRAANDLAASTGVKLISYVEMTRSLGPEKVHQA